MWDKILRRISGVQQNDTEEAISGPKNKGKSTADAPNIFLNLRPPNSHKQQVELWFWVVFAVMLQAGVLVFSGYATYRLSYEKNGDPVERYAYPLTAGGTLLVALGILICCLVVEGSTVENVWTFGKPARILWLQKGGNFNDQYFDSYAVFAHGSRHSILTSQLSMSVQAAPADNQTRKIYQTSHSRTTHEQTDVKTRTFLRLRETVVVLATTTSIGGFIIQFTGLRSMHWSATIAQLLATVVMVAIRAWIRRDLASTQLAYKVPEGFEMEWLATRLSRKPDADRLWGVQHASIQSVDRPLSVRMPGSKKPPLIDRARSTVQKLATKFHRRKVNRSGLSDTSGGLLEERCWYWNIASGHGVDDFIFSSIPVGAGSTGHRVMKMRKRIGSLCNWTGPASQPAVSLTNAIEVVMNTLFPKGDNESIFWTINSKSHEEPSKIFLSVKRNKKSGSRWKANAAEIESVLSLWMYSMHAGDSKLRNQAGDSRTPVEGDDEDWLRDGNTALRNTTIRLLGRGNELYLRDLQWHLGAGFDAIKEVTRYGGSEM